MNLEHHSILILPNTDVTPKALTHRIAKLRSMAEDASTPAAGASSGLPLPQPNRRNAPAKSTARAPATLSPAGKKSATAANKTPVTGSKRTAAGTVKKGNGKANGGSHLQNVVAASNGNGHEDEDDEEESSKKVKTAKAGKRKVATVHGEESNTAKEGKGGAKHT